MSPPAVPAKTRRPDANTASGSSVSVSTTTSPRMPCALRTRPTMMNAGGWGVMRGAPALRLVLAVAHRHGASLELLGQPRLVPLLQDTSFAKQRAHGIRGLRADIEPVVDAIAVEIERFVARGRLI